MFPLVEDDLDLDKDSQLREYIMPSSPFHSPSQSSRSSPPPFFRSSPSLDTVSSHSSLSTMKPKKERKKADINAELRVQDALLALHLKEFLLAQGICEEDPRVDFDEEGRMVETEIGIVTDEAKKETVDQVQQEEDNILDEWVLRRRRSTVVL